MKKLESSEEIEKMFQKDCFTKRKACPRQAPVSKKKPRKIIMPSDKQQRKPGPVTVRMLPTCCREDCNKYFIKNSPRQIYCCVSCRKLAATKRRKNDE